jgi:hypothetical protein
LAVASRCCGLKAPRASAIPCSCRPSTNRPAERHRRSPRRPEMPGRAEKRCWCRPGQEPLPRRGGKANTLQSLPLHRSQDRPAARTKRPASRVAGPRCRIRKIEPPAPCFSARRGHGHLPSPHRDLLPQARGEARRQPGPRQHARQPVIELLPLPAKGLAFRTKPQMRLDGAGLGDPEMAIQVFQQSSLVLR